MKSFSILSLTLAISLSAQAQEVSSEALSNQSSIESPKSRSRIKLSSEEARYDKNLILTGGLGFEYSELGYNASLGFYIQPDHILSVDIFYASDVGEDYSYVSNGQKRTVKRDKDQSTFTASLNYQYFISNSFFIKSGLFYGHYKNMEDIDELNNRLLLSGRSDLNRIDLGAKFSIGNQWQWSNFTLGCEWFGVQRGLVNLKKSGVDERIFTGTKDEKDWLSFTLAKISLGASF